MKLLQIPGGSMLRFIKAIVRVHFLLALITTQSFSQSKVTGIINNGGQLQSSGGYQITGCAGQTSIIKSSGTSYLLNAGFWHQYTNKTFVYPSVIQLSQSYSFGDPAKTTSYKMIGIPGANDIPLANIMSGNAGKQGDWIAYWDEGSGNYTEYSSANSSFRLTPGRAFWVLSKNPVNIGSTNVSTVSLSTDYTFPIPLHSEWNLISNPFEKSVSWQSIKDANAGITQPIYFFNGNPAYIQPSVFEPYKGYYFFNSTGLTSLKVPYISEAILPKDNTEQISIILSLGGTVVTSADIGFSESSSNGTDDLDIYSPPAQFSEAGLSIFNKELNTTYKYLKKDFRKEINEGQEYNLLIKNISDVPMKIHAEGLELLSGYQVYIADNTGKFFDLTTRPDIVIKPGTTEKIYFLFIGTDEYIRQKKLLYIPAEFSLYQNYPNPFNPSTSIRFALPSAGQVTLKVYNSIGEITAELLSSQAYEAGYHEIVFNGSSAASGVYIYRLQVESAGEVKFSHSGKMLLLK